MWDKSLIWYRDTARFTSLHIYIPENIWNITILDRSCIWQDRFYVLGGRFMSKLKAEIMDSAASARALKRIAHEILERNGGSKDICFAGIKRGGVPIAELLAENIYQIEGVRVPVGIIDTVSHRDDRSDIPVPEINTSDIPFSVTDKKVIMVDDVLYTGRTARAAMEALISFGRPAAIQLAVLVDRGHRELPIRGDFVGKNIPTARSEKILVKSDMENREVTVGLYEV